VSMPPSRSPGSRRGAAGRDQAAEAETRPARVEAAAAETLRAEVEAAIKDRLLATIDELGQDAVLWLAAPPVWTLGAARAAGFPAAPLIEFVRRACAAGWCKARGPLLDNASPDLVFWMPDEVRRAVVDVLRGRLGDKRLRQDHRRVAVRALQVAETLIYEVPPGLTVLPGDEVPGALAAWADLMIRPPLPRTVPPARDADGKPASPSGTDLGTGLVARTQQAVADRDLGRAQDLVAAGEAIAGVLAGTTEQALSRARRLLALGQRRRQDERALNRYLDRPELSGAVARLLDRGEQEGPWALHLRGVGGVGKTMLIRYLASGRYAAGRGLPPIPVARADFDRINPDYPVRRPVQLLLELADELALHAAASDRADQALTAFRARAARAHEAVSGLREAGGSPLRNPEVALAVDRFGDVLAELGNVLLILDTCEELAKADLGNPATPAVRATLDIIERLHERAPTARVLFAGRRPLPGRPYLAVQPVAGFTVDEARRYLAASAARPLPPELAEEMIRQSAAVDGPVPAAGQLPARVSPFDLALYAAWADEDEELDVAQVSRGSDAYVEGRIVERLADPLVVRALPVLAAAGRCRVATIAALLDCDPELLGRRLAEQEWIDADGDPVTHVAARPTLAVRLRGYFESDERRAEFAARAAALASALLDRARLAPLAEIDVDELLAALRLAEPAAAAALWDSIADRATEPPGRWGTVLNLTRRVLGEWDEEEWPTTTALRATVTAAHIAASRRDSPLFDASGPWRTVLSWAARHPDQGSRRLLLARAAFGLLVSSPEFRSSFTHGPFTWDMPSGGYTVTITPDNWAALTRAPSCETAALVPGEIVSVALNEAPEVAAAVVDAAHLLLEERGSRVAAGSADAVPAASESSPLFAWLPLDLIDQLSGPKLRAWALVARARALTDTDAVAARYALAEAESLAATDTGPEPSWPDCLPPDDLLARVRIERGLIAPPEDLTVLDEWESYATDRLDGIDGERLASLCLRIRLRHGMIDTTVAGRWETADAYNPDRVPTGTAHDLVPPLSVSVAQAWMSAGEPERALALLDSRRRAALGTRQDDLTARHADAATTAIIRRLRLADRQSTLVLLAGGERHSGASGPAGLGDIQPLAWRALAVVSPGLFTAPFPYIPADPQWWHAWWQSAGLRTLAGRADQPPTRPSSLTSMDVADIRADLAEIRRLERFLGRGALGALAGWETALGDWLEPAPPAPPTRTAEPHRELRAAMRLAALAGETFEIPPHVPSRLLAEMAFEEAELTALRLPDVAGLLFLTAAFAYRAAGDPLGEFLARVSVLIAGHPSDGPTATGSHAAVELADEARDALMQMPEVFVALNGMERETGPWRNWTPDGRAETGWAQAVREAAELTAVGPAAASAPASTQVTAPTQVTAAARPSPPAGSGPAARRAGPSGTLWVATAVLAACLVAGLGALGVFTLLSGTVYPIPTPTQHPATTSAAGTATTAVSTGVSSPATTITSNPPPVTSPASTEPVGHQAAPGSGESPVPWIVALLAGLGVLAALLGWYLPKLVRLASWRGVGAARLGTLLFDVRLNDLPMHYLQVRPRPWRTAPPRLRALLWLFTPAGWFERAFPRIGYYGFVEAATASEASPRHKRVQWMPPRPKASTAWWHSGRGSALGVIRELGRRFRNLGFLAEPWERLLVAGLSPDAAGRIEWIRLVDTIGPLLFEPGSQQATLLAPPAWARALSQYYATSASSTEFPWPAHFTGLLHVIGRAVATSAGPAMDTGVEAPAESGAQRLLFGVTELKQLEPAMIILQAEPAPGDTIGAGPPDDQAEKLRLGAALAGDGIPAVLLLPVLPAETADELARIVTAHAGLGPSGDARLLLTRVRAVVAPHVAPQVLDDIVLFLNVRRYRS